MAVYSTEVNTEIINFLSRAQTKIAEISAEIADKVSKRRAYESYREQLEMAWELECFIDALDNNYNSWTEAEIVRYVHYWDNRAKIRNYPYVFRERFNVRINFD